MISLKILTEYGPNLIYNCQIFTNVEAVTIPSIPKHEGPQQLHSGSTVVSLGQTEPSGEKARSGGRDH